MTVVDRRGTDTAAPVILTATVGRTARRLSFWFAMALVLVLLALGSLAVVGAAEDLPRLSADSAAPDGARAVAEVLRDQGVEVTATDVLAETIEAVGDGSDTTLVVYDEFDNLADDGHQQLIELGIDLIVLDPPSGLLAAVAPEVRQAGMPDDDPLEPSCTIPAVVEAGSVSSGGDSYRLIGSDGETCLRSDSDSDDDAFSLIRVETDGTTVTVLGATDALTNGAVLDDGNAVFALTLLGERERLVWYLPSVADSLEPGEDLSALTPGWLTPVIALAALVVVAAAVWRGRRFGPLIVENLPVVVRASETMEGRARLYQRSSARLRALDALRLGTISRLARTLGLPGSASVDEIVGSLAALLRRDTRDIRSLLVDDDPASDAELVRLSDRLLELEAAATTAARP